MVRTAQRVPSRGHAGGAEREGAISARGARNHLLTEAQQRDALTQRLGAAGVEDLMPFVDRMPIDIDPDTKAEHRVTDNPLMLSMVASGE